MTSRRDFLAGVRAMGPALLGVAPFGLICGVSAVEVGLSPAQAMGLSLFVFAGTSQLAAIELVGQGAGAAVVILTVAVINVRMTMYSASLAPHLREYSARWRSVLSYLLTDHVYAFTMAIVEDTDRSVSVRWYALGLGVAIWTVWQLTTLLGIALGTTVPDRFGLDLVVPLTFIAILVPRLKDRTHVAAAASAGLVAVAGAGVPLNLGLVAGGLLGVFVGVAVEEVTEA